MLIMGPSRGIKAMGIYAEARDRPLGLLSGPHFLGGIEKNIIQGGLMANHPLFHVL